MEKRYQVFVSSTYQDLQEERHEVMQALLELDCIPSGMELFPAANEDQWTLIKQVIDDSDYYIVIIGGRYGSIGPHGISFTEMEYRYALEKGKPIIAFLHKDPGKIQASRTEKDSESINKLNEFRGLTQQKLVKYWSTPTDLGSMVSRSLVRLIKTIPAIGWVRADQVPDESATKEILKLRKKIEELEFKLNEARTKAPQGSEDLAQGDDEIEISYSYVFITQTERRAQRNKDIGRFMTTWNEIFSRVAPTMINEASESKLKLTLDEFLQKESIQIVKGKIGDNILRSLEIDNIYFQTIIIQLRALGLIVRNERQRSLKDAETYWSLTPYGDEIMTKLIAIKRVYEGDEL